MKRLAMLSFFSVCLLLLVSGCTFHFKGTDVEAGGEVVKNPANHTYILEKADLF